VRQLRLQSADQAGKPLLLQENMPLKRHLLIAISTICVFALGCVAAYTYCGRQTAQLLGFQQEASLEEWAQLAFDGYRSGNADVGVWVLKRYVDKLNAIYSVRPIKDRSYYYLSFVAHARLAKLYSLKQDINAQTNEIRLAEESSTGWSREMMTNEAFIFESLRTIDELNARYQNHLEMSPF